MKFLIYISIVVIISTLILSLVFIYYEKGKDQFHPTYNSNIEEVVRGNNEHDILFIGSSRTLVHVNPIIIDSITKLSSYNAGISGANLLEMNLMLKCYLKNRKPPKLVVADLSVNAFDIAKRPINKIQNYTSVIDDSIVYQTLKPYKNLFLLKHFPFLQITNDDDEKKVGAAYALLGKKIKAFQNKPFKGYRGGRTDTLTMPFKGFKNNYTYKITKEGIELFMQLIETCKKHGIKLIISYSPEFFLLDNNYHHFFDLLQKICAETKIPLWDYRKSSLCKNHRLFADPIHLNKYGADEFSNLLAYDITNF